MPVGWKRRQRFFLRRRLPAVRPVPMNWKGRIILLHRWLGIALCLLMAAWFASAFVMIYVGFPNLTSAERCSGLEPLPTNGWNLLPAEARSVAGLEAAPQAVRFGTLLGRPVFRLKPDDGSAWRTVFADDRTELVGLKPSDAVEIARRFSRFPGAAQHNGLIDMDQWTVSSGLNALRPLHRIRIADESATELYVSDRTGEVVRDTRRTERLLNYMGAVTHWIYPTFLRRHVVAWRTTGRILSGAATILVATGLLLGMRRWYRRRGMASRTGGAGGRWLRAHLMLGTVSGGFALAWVFSGFLSFRIASIFDDGEATRAQVQAFAGNEQPIESADGIGIGLAIQGSGRYEVPVEGEVVRFAGRTICLLRDVSGRTSMVSAGPASSGTPVTLDKADLLAQAPMLRPGARISAESTLLEYDSHYYSRRPGENPRPLPAVRVEFNDAAKSWFHLDPATGQVIDRSTDGSRAYRWLFNGLHSLDWPWLAKRRPLWDIVVCLLLTTGLFLSLTGVWLGWKRLKITTT